MQPTEMSNKGSNLLLLLFYMMITCNGLICEHKHVLLQYAMLWKLYDFILCDIIGRMEKRVEKEDQIWSVQGGLPPTRIDED